MDDLIKKSLIIQAPIDRVWEHITDSEKIARWLMPNNFQAQEGAQFNMHCEPQGGSSGLVECAVKVLEPPRKLVYSWKIDTPPVTTQVTILLTSVEDGTRLELEHSGWSILAEADLHVRERHDMGWDHLLGTALRKLVEG